MSDSITAVLQKQFQSVEVALNTLVESIASYNPSTEAAVSLIEADDELSRGLEQLAIHQANHARLTSLHETSATLSTQITQTLTVLSDTRRELLATPATVFPKESRDVPYDELLSYANKISRFTAPPGFRPPVQPPAAAATDQAGGGLQPDGQQQSSAAVNGSQEVSTPGVGVAALPAQETHWLNSTTANLGFTPWPSEDTIRRGGLAQIQSMIEANQDPWQTPLYASGQQDGKGDEVRFKREETGEEAVAPKKAAVFGGLDLYDPDEGD
ncbi:MAG: hypothetical protein M1817_002011 [Caeruleum heppii]|nr:MAG: hypothetical protein M1817_002011 [Caeruleum heppii]